MRHLDDAAETEFAAFFTARFPQVRRLAYLLCGDWHGADDLAQTAFVRVASSWHRIRRGEALDAYVRTCLMRSFLSEQRRAWRRREASRAAPPDRPAPGDGADAITDRVAVLRALAQVPPRQRAALVCRFYDGLDVAGAAQALGCSEGNVKSQTARGLAALRAALGDAVPQLAAALSSSTGRGNLT
jgi:RNA polymerase sigma-70 factor (sigma-E family)